MPFLLDSLPKPEFEPAKELFMFLNIPPTCSQKELSKDLYYKHTRTAKRKIKHHSLDQ